jgi:hypothetical protein
VLTALHEQDTQVEDEYRAGLFANRGDEPTEERFTEARESPLVEGWKAFLEEARARFKVSGFKTQAQSFEL